MNLYTMGYHPHVEFKMVVYHLYNIGYTHHLLCLL
jgi:hypothetical protein